MSSVRRIKERGGGGGKVAAGLTTAPASTAVKTCRSVTPVSEKSITGGDAARRSTGKENPRPTSRVRAAAATAASSSSLSQKPVIRPMPRIDKYSACAGGENPGTRAQRSVSSVPRGRSSSSYEFNRALSDLRKNSRVAVDQCEKVPNFGRSVSSGARLYDKSKQKIGTLNDSDVNANKKGVNGIRAVIDSKERPKISVNVDNVGEFCKEKESKSDESAKVRDRISDDCSKRANFSSIDKVPSMDCLASKANVDPNLKTLDGVKDLGESNISSGRVSGCKNEVGRSDKGTDLGPKDVDKKPLSRSGGSDSLKEKGSVEGLSGRSANKYRSKLHEKLAFLEGKVKRIASDIKKTKEMLDMNNPDASKLILTDIQEKISGIEKAMGTAVNGSDKNTSSPEDKAINSGVVNVSEGSHDKQENVMCSSIKGLNTEELEARFFPHHKLLRGRISLKSSTGSCENRETNPTEPSEELQQEEKSLSTIDENQIAMQFLDSYNKDPSILPINGGAIQAMSCEVQEADDSFSSTGQDSSLNLFGMGNVEIVLTSNERLGEFDEQENRSAIVIDDEPEDSSVYLLNDISCKNSTGGWFVSEGESILLAHADGTCSFYDIANCEEKAQYKPPIGVSPNLWRDCWIIRAPGADGCSGRYVVAASAGNSLDSGYCSWDFYSKDVRAFHIEDGNTTPRKALAPLPNNTMYRRNTLSAIMASENHQWWYKPCGPLIISTSSCQRVVKIYDIRDGEPIMKWDVQKPVLAMDYSSPLQWRNRGKVVVAETDSISLWDVSSLSPQALLSVSSSGRNISALHVNNTDAELGGGVRQRVSSSEAEGNDGVFCTLDSINVLDFRLPSGVGLKIPKFGVNVHSVFSRGDSILLGCTSLKSAMKKQSCSEVQQFSLRKQKLFSSYALPESNAHAHHTAITQVWGNSNYVMGTCGLGLFVFDALKDDGMQSCTADYSNLQKVREVIGPDDLYSPSFDYLSSRVLLISRDRPAMWRYLS